MGRFCLWWKRTFKTPREDLIEHVDRIEGHYKDIKTDLEKIQKSIDPIARLLVDMESQFKKETEKK